MVDEAKTRQWDGRLAWVIAAVALQCLTAGFAEAKTVGIWMDRKSGNITGATNSLAKAFGGKTLSFGGHDHFVLKGGEWGKPFAMSAEDPCGFYGDYRSGRVIAFGGGFTYSLDDITHDDMERIFLAMAEWLAAAPKPSAAQASKDADEAERAQLGGSETGYGDNKRTTTRGAGQQAYDSKGARGGERALADDEN